MYLYTCYNLQPRKMIQFQACVGIIIPAKWGQLSGKAPDLWSKGLRFKSQEEQQENFLLWGQLSVLTFIQYLFHPRVPTVVILVGKRPQSFCQKCRWQVTAKHTCTLCTINLCMVVWCPQNVCQDSSSFTRHLPCNNQIVHYTWVDIQKHAIEG